MNRFERRDGQLHAEGVSIAHIADEVGTPVYIYSASALVDAYTALDRAFAGSPHGIYYSVKSNMNLAVIRTLAACGAGADVTSGGELFRALRAGVDPRRIVYSGVGKTAAEIDQALEAGIRMLNVESRAELRLIDRRAAAQGVRAPVAFRVNPDVDPRTHPYIATGLRTSKFGIPMGEAVEAYAEAKALDHVEVVGVDCHIGSQIVEVEPFADAMERLRALVLELRAAGHRIDVIDVGGGLGVTYAEEAPPTAEAYASAILEPLRELGSEILLEPGRSISANAGILVTRVLYDKHNDEKYFVIVDAAMNDMLRPTLYDAYLSIEPVDAARGSPRKADVVGPV
jgi:diaminopimelate decarboxylase